MIKKVEHGLSDTIGVDAAQGMQIGQGSVLYELIGDTQALDSTRVSLFTEEFEDGSAEATNQGAVLDGHHLVESLPYGMQQGRIKGFDKPHVVYRYGHSL